MEKESIRLSEGKLQEEKLSEKAAETFAWISAEVKMMLNDDSSKIAEMMIDGANMGIKSITEKSLSGSGKRKHFTCKEI